MVALHLFSSQLFLYYWVVKINIYEFIAEFGNFRLYPTTHCENLWCDFINETSDLKHRSHKKINIRKQTPLVQMRELDW